MSEIDPKTVEVDSLVRSMLKSVHVSSGELFDSLARNIVGRLSSIHNVSFKDIDEIEKLVLAEANTRNVNIKNLFTRQNNLYFLADRDNFFKTVIDKWKEQRK